MGRSRRRKTIKDVLISGIADKGKGIGRDKEGRVLFVEEVAPGDVVDVLTLRKKKGFFIGIPVVFHKYSEDRVEPFCQHFGVCGGCKWQHITYEAQLKHKQKVVEDALIRIGKTEAKEFSPILPAEKTTFYRNKLEFAFSNKRWLTKEELNTDISNKEDVLGFHRAGAFDKILNIDYCHLQSDPSNELRNCTRELAKEQGLEFFDVREGTGFLRHMLVRTTSIGESMLIVSFFKKDDKRISVFLNSIADRFPQLTTICYCINSKQNDSLSDLEMKVFKGKGFIEDELGAVNFKIGPKSFFQTNIYQAKELYDVVVDFAELDGSENVYDLYTGIGSIALYIAGHCRQVVGIEEVEDAIKDAEKNTLANDINNTIFYAGDVKNILTQEFADKHGKPDVLITDPPRAGMHPKVVQMLLQLEAPKIVYVSCNPSTQARDIQLLSEKYELLKAQPVDMFPHTHHIENVVLLKLRNQN